MKTIILCGGLGTRLGSETDLKPKPMVEIGNKPILWHIMKKYSNSGFNDFIIALGYRSEVIKNYFNNFKLYNDNFRINLENNEIEHLSNNSDNWNISLIETGKNSMTGGRILRLKDYVDNTFMVTYGDGLCNVDINELLKFHKSHGKIATLTTVRPPARFGGIKFDGNKVVDFKEKKQTDAGWINGGYFVFNKEVFDYIIDDNTVLEEFTLEKLVKNHQLMAFKHEGFWQCMDTKRDMEYLSELVNNKKTPWLI